MADSYAAALLLLSQSEFYEHNTLSLDTLLYSPNSYPSLVFSDNLPISKANKFAEILAVLERVGVSMMFAFRNMDDTLKKDTACIIELDYI